MQIGLKKKINENTSFLSLYSIVAGPDWYSKQDPAAD